MVLSQSPVTSPQFPVPKIRLILIAILLGLLTACGTGTPPLSLAPTNQLIQQAIALQVNQTQQQLSQQLRSSPPKFEITQLNITQLEPLYIQNLPAYHVQGTYNLLFQLSNRRTNQQQNSFDVYLQRQIEGKTWRLAIPQSASQNYQLSWRTYLIK